ncbi:Type 1 glutamine amidotransferase-like domain-containing protein [Streptomyces sp. ASQP_92]|uniref:Type 1 glutamine amidotransferase-like domain-containing protein n=1 Tax=Streptomyces sp. ASQP_92 TaxID=2979116 RepID=UPI0021BF73D8|nr:Type 1 glutamine amidotransferase-like domain-containing protein [Streptomyces sp. ASQP_92]MCT9092765.1 Type 1 glutamine amidotransferase-like domain-containing protein [Streptomyces sp. ASQP_92]
MRLFLSSWKLGDAPELLDDLVGQGRRAAVVGNALDALPDAHRRQATGREIAMLRERGYRVTEVDLRDHFTDAGGLAEHLAGFDVIWVHGGNPFVLRLALALSGADEILTALLRRDAVAYAGWSAGACVLSPTLRGLELVDDPADTVTAYGRPALWDGLGLLDYAFVPHYRSPIPESEPIERVVERYEHEKVPYRALRDGEVTVIGQPSTAARR